MKTKKHYLEQIKTIVNQKWCNNPDFVKETPSGSIKFGTWLKCPDDLLNELKLMEFEYEDDELGSQYYYMRVVNTKQLIQTVATNDLDLVNIKGKDMLPMEAIAELCEYDDNSLFFYGFEKTRSTNWMYVTHDKTLN